MSCPEITRDIAFAAGEDAANKRMRGEGRTTWNEDDYAEAAEVANRMLLTVPLEDGGLKGLEEEILRRDHPDLCKRSSP